MQKFNFFTLFLILQVLVGLSQTNTSSPYSRYGVGELLTNGSGQTRAMGGVGIGLYEPVSINIVNPASYTSFDKNTFIFEFGLKTKATTFKSSNDSYSDNNSNIDYFNLGFPVIHSKWHSSIGMKPFSFVGYSVEMFEPTPVDTAKHSYLGEGGLQHFYIGNSFKFFKRLSFGFNFGYIFGDLNYTRRLDFPGSSFVYNLYNRQNTSLGDVYLNYGLVYSDTLFVYQDSTKNKATARKIKYSLGAIYDGQTSINGSSSVFTTTSLGGGSSLDTLQNEIINDGQVILPQKTGFGFSISFLNGMFKQNNSRFTIAADYRIQNWEEARFFDRNDSLLNNNTMAFGLEYVPNYFPRINVPYTQRIFYRLGFQTNSGYIKVNNTAIKNFGISFGLGLPINKFSKSLMNISIEYGKTGTLANNLLQENYWVVSFSLSLHDRWFVKRKFD